MNGFLLYYLIGYFNCKSERDGKLISSESTKIIVRIIRKTQRKNKKRI